MDIEIEIIGTVHSADALREYYVKGIRGKHFIDKNCKKIYTFALDYYLTHGKQSEAPTIEILRNEFKDTYTTIVENASGAAPSYLVEQIKELYIKRETLDVFQSYAGEISNDAIGGATAIRNSLSIILDNCTNNENTLDYKGDLTQYRKEVAALKQRTGVPYPFKVMTEHSGGILPGELAILVAPPGTGKTLFACIHALEAARAGYKVFFASLELTKFNVAERIELIQANRNEPLINVGEYVHGGDYPQYRDYIYQAQEEIASLEGSIIIDETPIEDRSARGIVERCKSRGCNFLIIDQLQFVQRDESKSLSESYGEALRELKQSIMSPIDGIKLPVLLLHQMNREGSKQQSTGTGHVGNMTNIAGSAWVEQIADVVWGLGRSREEQENDYMNIATLKVRNIPPLGVKLQWDSTRYFQFNELKDIDGKPVYLDRW